MALMGSSTSGSPFYGGSTSGSAPGLAASQTGYPQWVEDMLGGTVPASAQQAAATPGGITALGSPGPGAVTQNVNASTPGGTLGAPPPENLTAPGGMVSGPMAGWTLPGANQLFRTPEMMLREVFNQQYGGYGLGSPGGAAYYEALPYMANANAMAMMANPNANMASSDYGNWLNAFSQNLVSPGWMPNTNALIGNLLNPGAASKLGAYTQTGDASTQVSRTLGMMKAALDMGMHPLYAQAMMEQAAEAGGAYQLDVAKGGMPGSFVTQLAQSPYFSGY